MKSYEKHIAPESDYYVYSPSKTAQEMFFYPLQCGHFIYAPGYSLRRESFDSFLIMYIQKGSLLLEVDGRNAVITAGHFILLDCYRLHAYSSQETCECLWCHFDGPLARRWCESVISRLGNAFAISEPNPALGRLEALYDIFAFGAVVREPQLSKCLTDILTSFLLYAPPAQAHYDYAGMAEEAITYINEHFTKNLTVEELAGRVSLSPCHFIRTFKRETGFTPHEYIINIRLATARYLLKNTQMSVKDICYSTGFSCESVFCSAFKRRQSMTPAQYRAHSANPPR